MKAFYIAGLAVGLLFLTISRANGGDNMGLMLKSPDFKDGEVIPRRFSCEGDDISPELLWEGAPEGTKSFALIVEDPDAPMGTFVHWIVYDMPPAFRHLYQGVGNDTGQKNGIKQGSTDFGHTGYGGPCPPKGHGRHRYNFILRALDVPSLGLTEGARRNEVEKAMNGHVIAETRMTGVFQR